MSSLGYEAAKHNVKTFLSVHLAKIEATLGHSKFDRHLTTILSDVNDTLAGSAVDAELNQFLCDWHDAGLPVAIMTAYVDQELPFEIVERLKAEAEHQWFYPKPFHMSDIRPGMAIDDDERIAKLAGVTGMDIRSDEAIDFLRSWAQLKPKDKQEFLKPFVDFDAKAYPKMSAASWTDPTVEALYEQMTVIFERDPAALLELKWLVDGDQPSVYQDYVPMLENIGFLNKDGSVPPIAALLVRECVRYNPDDGLLDLGEMPVTNVKTSAAKATPGGHD